jgi:alkylhydroperoxidase family enzyme
MRLEPIENPPSFLLKIAYWFCKRTFGKVLAPLNIIYARKWQLLSFAMKIDKFTEKQNSLSPGLRLFIKIAAAAQNGCSFCTDLALANAVKGKIGMEKFNSILRNDISKQTVFSEKERAVFNFVKGYGETKKISDEIFAELQKQFNETEIVEIVAINAFEQYFNALAIPLEIESDGLQKLALAKINTN